MLRLALVLLTATALLPDHAFAADAGAFTLLDAVRSTVALHPLLKAAGEETAASEARRRQATGAFDLHYGATASQGRSYTPLTDYDHALAIAAGIDTFSQTQNASIVTAQSTTLLRNGVSYGPVLDLVRLSDNLENLGGVNRASLDFAINVPLKRGRGREVVTAPERAASEEVDASVLDQNETIASLVFSTATAYWNYVSAVRILQIRRASEQRGADYLANVRTLIAAQRMPGIEAHEAIANLDSQSTARILAEQRVVEARQNLGYAMGLGAVEAQAIPLPAEDFPEGPPNATGNGDLAGWISRALLLRPAYLATEKHTQSAETLRTAARNQLLPQVDLTVKSGYSGLHAGTRPDQYIDSLGARIQGVDFSAQLSYNFARGNNTAKGQLAEAEANYRRSTFLATDTANRIAASVASALSAVDTSTAALSGAKTSVSEYQSATEGAREKLRLAAGSLLDLLTIESRLTGSELDLENARLQYALAIVELRYASGTMLGPDPLHPTLEREAFRVPAPPPGVKN